jgi:hypothetical protein
MMYGVANTATPAEVKAGKFKNTERGCLTASIHKE